MEKSKETIIETISRNEKDGKINQECISTVTLVTLIIQKKKKGKKDTRTQKTKNTRKI